MFLFQSGSFLFTLVDVTLKMLDCINIMYNENNCCGNN